MINKFQKYILIILSLSVKTVFGQSVAVPSTLSPQNTPRKVIQLRANKEVRDTNYITIFNYYLEGLKVESEVNPDSFTGTFDTAFFDTGKVKSITEYKNVILKDTLISYGGGLDNDSLVYDIYQKRKYLKHGVYIEFNKKGRRIISGFYRKGEKSELWTFYDKRGRIIKKEEWKNGFLESRSQ